MYCIGQLPSCGCLLCLLYRNDFLCQRPPHATPAPALLPLSVCFFVARSAEVINKAQRASKTDREREGDTRAVTTNYGTVKVSDEAHLSGSLDRKGQSHVTGSWLRLFCSIFCIFLFLLWIFANVAGVVDYSAVLGAIFVLVCVFNEFLFCLSFRFALY